MQGILEKQTWAPFGVCLLLTFSPQITLAAVQDGRTSIEIASPHRTAQGTDDHLNLPDLRSRVRRVVVLAGSDDWSFRREMNEGDLPSISCTYEFDHPDNITALLDLLERADIRADSTPERGFDVRMGIYFYESNGAKVSILLSRPMKSQEGNRRSRGIYQRTRFSVDAEFYDGVRTILAQRRPSQSTFYCTQNPM